MNPAPPISPERVTHSAGNDQLLYFTSTSVLADDGGLVYLSDRDGHPNLFYLNLRSGEDRQLTDNREGILKSYVYFSGTAYRGFGKASVSLDAERGIAYYIQGREIRAVDLHGKIRVLAQLQEGQMTAFTHVSADGSRLCVPTTDARALEDETPLPMPHPGYDIDARVREEGLSSYLRVFDTGSGRELCCEPVPRAWVTHVQFSPTSPEVILYNNEWPAECGIRRMWIWDGKRHFALRTESAEHGRSRQDWTCHEVWEADGSAIIYHGAYHEGPAYLGRVSADGRDIVEIPLPAEWKQYGHFTGGRPGLLVSDGYFQTPETARAKCGAWLSLVLVDWTRRSAEWRPLTQHRSSWNSQDAHPHPIFDHGCRHIYYTSDCEGGRAIYRIALGADFAISGAGI